MEGWKEDGGSRVLNIGFQLINWPENGAGELEQQVFTERGSITSEADVSLLSKLRLRLSR